MTAPTFGYLAAIIPTKKARTILHTCTAGFLVEGKVSVTHKNPYPTRVRIGVVSGALQNFTGANYIVYDYVIDPGESYETDTIYYGNNQSLVVFSHDENTSFIIHGEILANPSNSGFLSSIKIPQANIKQLLYTVPAGQEISLSVFATNQGPNPSVIRVAISNTGLNVPSANYLEFQTKINPRDTYYRSNIKASGGQSLVVYSDSTDVNFSVYGKFNYNVVSADLGIGGDLSVGGDGLIEGDFSTEGDLSVGGLSTFDGDVDLNADLTITNGVLSIINNSLVKFSVSSTTGTITTAGSVSATGGISLGGNISVASNKFIVSSITGNVALAGNISIGGGVTDDLNVLNNRVINLADPQNPTDATSRKYVDAKVAALAIALS